MEGLDKEDYKSTAANQHEACLEQFSTNMSSIESRIDTSSALLSRNGGGGNYNHNIKSIYQESLLQLKTCREPSVSS